MIGSILNPYQILAIFEVLIVFKRLVFCQLLRHRRSNEFQLSLLIGLMLKSRNENHTTVPIVLVKLYRPKQNREDLRRSTSYLESVVWGLLA
jgi:hypothetical protein